MSVYNAAVWLLLFCGIAIGYILGSEFPPCTAGAQRGCNVESGKLGVQHCRRGGFGWERCQGFEGSAYPQAFWRAAP